ncbi:MAG: hypothetical protein ACI8W9_001367, partial [Psychromonas sp.]
LNYLQSPHPDDVEKSVESFLHYFMMPTNPFIGNS